jgi:hypothetical protein
MAFICEGVDWIDLAQVRNQWWVLNTVPKLWIL